MFRIFTPESLTRISMWVTILNANAPSSDCVVPCIVKSGRDYDNGMRSLDLVLLLSLAHLHSMWSISYGPQNTPCVSRPRVIFFGTRYTRVNVNCYDCMGLRTATGIFPALRLVHSLLKYFFQLWIWYWIQFYTTKYSNLILSIDIQFISLDFW